MRKTIYLALSLDVEEEGLFRGSYAQKNVGVDNTRSLRRLLPLLKEGIRPTLFCAYPVFKDASSCDELRYLRDEWGAEIGAHLHHWNTPPRDPSLTHDSPLSSVPSCQLTDELFEAKMNTLLSAACDFQKSEVTSFRMGRWDIHQNHWPILAKLGIRTDASVRPLHGRGLSSLAPDHFGAPSSAYWIATKPDPILEVPLTCTPIVRAIPSMLSALSHSAPPVAKAARYLMATMNYWGALALLPCYHPLWAMEIVSSLSIARGANLLSLTFHSSELHPGATPHLPTEAHVHKLISKVHAYIRYLKERYDIVCLPMSELHEVLGADAPRIFANEGEDYSIPACEA